MPAGARAGTGLEGPPEGAAAFVRGFLARGAEFVLAGPLAFPPDFLAARSGVPRRTVQAANAARASAASA
jgi:hypothetical protein